MQHIVLGAGEVGRAVAEVLAYKHSIWLRDIEPSGPTKADVLHVCFGWSSSFEITVRDYMRYYQPSLVIVHSTVPVGTCERLDVVHSPVTGKHPDLAKSILTFTKFFGGWQASLAASIFEQCGVTTRVLSRASECEAGKLWELTQYGIAIAVEKQIHAYCEAHGLDFDVVYTAFAHNYNEGYERLGYPEFSRPVLSHVDGPIGGHCVVPGAVLLNEGTLSKLVIEAGKEEVSSDSANHSPNLVG